MSFMPNPVPGPTQFSMTMIENWTYYERETGVCEYNEIEEGNTTACDLSLPGGFCDDVECDTEWEACEWYAN